MSMPPNDPAASISFTPLRTERLLLRQMREDDLAAFIHFHTVSKEHLRPWSPRLAEGQTVESRFCEQLERAERTLRDGTAVRLSAFDEPTGRIVGNFALNNIVRGVFQCADAGWVVGAEFIGHGFATEGVQGLLDLAFAAPPLGIGLHRAQANINPENAPSLRVAAKCGFRVEGLARAMLMIDGAWRDHTMHAKLADEHRLRYLG